MHSYCVFLYIVTFYLNIVLFKSLNLDVFLNQVQNLCTKNKHMSQPDADDLQTDIVHLHNLKKSICKCDCKWISKTNVFFLELIPLVCSTVSELASVRARGVAYVKMSCGLTL